MKALHRTEDEPAPHYAPGHSRALDWRKSMSDNVAYALLVYTGLQIFWTVQTMKELGGSILPYLSLVVLVAGIIPACRWFEKRWRDLPDDRAADPALRGAFRRDQVLLWALAIALPLMLSAVFMAIGAVA